MPGQDHVDEHHDRHEHQRERERRAVVALARELDDGGGHHARVAREVAADHLDRTDLGDDRAEPGSDRGDQAHARLGERERADPPRRRTQRDAPATAARAGRRRSPRHVTATITGTAMMTCAMTIAVWEYSSERSPSGPRRDSVIATMSPTKTGGSPIPALNTTRATVRPMNRFAPSSIPSGRPKASAIADRGPRDTQRREDDRPHVERARARAAPSRRAELRCRCSCRRLGLAAY